MHKLLWKVLLLSFLVTVLSCSVSSEQAKSPLSTSQGILSLCTEPRAQVCTQEYRPVCAELESGSLKTYSNGCTACSNPSVTEYREGGCEK
jgi:hypothetical protein